MLSISKTELLKTVRSEINKEYLEYDSQNRVSKIYRAPSFIEVGGPCIVVEYLYSGLFPLAVVGRKEGYSVWQEAFEGEPVLLTDDLFEQLTDDLGNELTEF
jgi:hypothetical protein